MNIGVAEALDHIAGLKTKKEKVEALKKLNNFTVRTVLQGVFDPRIVWQLPAGEVPYTANPLKDLEGVLHTEARKLYIFVKGGADAVPQVKRETMFIQFLENLDARDAYMMVFVKDKKLPPEMKSITKEVVKEAFPDLLS